MSNFKTQKKARFSRGRRAHAGMWMRVPLELEHLIRSACEAGPTAAATQSLGACLSAVEVRRALEVENYLRACALRLEQTVTSNDCTGNIH